MVLETLVYGSTVSHSGNARCRKPVYLMEAKSRERERWEEGFRAHFLCLSFFSAAAAVVIT